MSNKNENKASITKFLLDKAKMDLLSGIEAHKDNLIEAEIQIGINVNLLLGIALEGIVNEIGENIVGNEWEDIETTSVITKLVIIFKLRGEAVNKGKKPFQLFNQLISLRNKIAHPKLESIGNDVILISDNGQLVKNPTDDYILPNNEFSIYIGYEKLLEKFNINVTLKNMKEALESIRDVMKLSPNAAFSSYYNNMYEEIKKIKI